MVIEFSYGGGGVGILRNSFFVDKFLSLAVVKAHGQKTRKHRRNALHSTRGGRPTERKIKGFCPGSRNAHREGGEPSNQGPRHLCREVTARCRKSLGNKGYLLRQKDVTLDMGLEQPGVPLHRPERGFTWNTLRNFLDEEHLFMSPKGRSKISASPEAARVSLKFGGPRVWKISIVRARQVGARLGAHSVRTRAARTYAGESGDLGDIS